MVPKRFVLLTEQEAAQIIELLGDDPDYKAFAKAVGIDRTVGVLSQRAGVPVSEQYRQLRGIPQQQAPARVERGGVDLAQENISEQEMMEEGYGDDVPLEGQEMAFDEGNDLPPQGGGFPQYVPPQVRGGNRNQPVNQQVGLRGPQNQGRQQSTMMSQQNQMPRQAPTKPFQAPMQPPQQSRMAPMTGQRQSGMPSQVSGGSQNQAPLRRGSPPEGPVEGLQSKVSGSPEEVDEFGEFVEDDF